MAPLTDEALVTAAQSGDRNALDQLLRRHYDRIYAVCRRISGSTADADDSCQEALIKISRNLPRFDGRSAFGTWAYRIATNASLDELRKRNRRPRLHTAADGREPDVVDPTAATRVTGVVDRLAIDEALAELADDFRVAVVLRDVIDLDYSEIAAILEVPVGTVKSRIARGRSTLASRLRLQELLTDPKLDVDRMLERDDPHEESNDSGNPSGSAERPTKRTPNDLTHDNLTPDNLTPDDLT